MEQRVSLITLGVADLPRATAFYEALAWRRTTQSQGEITFFQLAGQALALYPRHLMDEDLGRAAGTGPGSIVLSQNVRVRSDVDRLFAEAISAGATPLAMPNDTPWGGYVAHVADPDGHPWEFAHVPMFPLNADGTLTLPGGED